MAYAEKRVPDYFEYHASFFEAVTLDPAGRSILVGPRGWEFAVGQVSDYRGGAALFVTEGYIVPEQLDEQGRPSLVDAISRFLDEYASASVFGGANAGWGEVWHVLATV